MTEQSAALEEIERLRSVLRAVRFDLWRASAHSNLRLAHECRAEALAKLDGELGAVTAEERLETLFPNLKTSREQEAANAPRQEVT